VGPPPTSTPEEKEFSLVESGDLFPRKEIRLKPAMRNEDLQGEAQHLPRPIGVRKSH